jgi:hypothetical protein
MVSAKAPVKAPTQKVKMEPISWGGRTYYINIYRPLPYSPTPPGWNTEIE